MRELTREWLDKADGDFRVANREVQVTEGPSYEVVCCHCQQCVEKLIKGFLFEHDVIFPKTHDIGSLLTLCLPYRPQWEEWEEHLFGLTSYAVEYRYLGDHATHTEAIDAFEVMTRFREMMLAEFDSL